MASSVTHLLSLVQRVQRVCPCHSKVRISLKMKKKRKFCKEGFYWLFNSKDFQLLSHNQESLFLLQVALYVFSYNSDGTECRFCVTFLCQEGEEQVIHYMNNLSIWVTKKFSHQGIYNLNGCVAHVLTCKTTPVPTCSSRVLLRYSSI